MPGQTGIHGFSTWLDFIKATISLGAMLTIGLYTILTFALDGRYAAASISDQVERNGKVATQVQQQVANLKTIILQEQIFEMRVRGCSAQGESRRFYARRLQDLMRQYREIAGDEAIVPSCSDVK